MYADDTVIISSSSSGLQKALDKLHAYCLKWRLQVNRAKTKILIFCKRKVDAGDKFRYASEELELVTDYVYLGINFNATGSFTNACARLVELARRATFKLRSICGDAPVHLYLTLFDSLVLPILLYGVELWGPFFLRNVNELNFKRTCDKFPGESVALKFYRSILGVNRFASNDAVRGELGRSPVLLNGIRLAVKYWEQLVKLGGRNDLLLSAMRESDRLNMSWACVIRRILSTADIVVPNPLCRLPVMTHNKSIFGVCHARLSLLYSQQWRAVINGQPAGGSKANTKLRTYCTFKDDFSLSSYLHLRNKSKRQVFTKLRIGAHKLQIEVGRHRRPIPIPADERVCTKCGSGAVENEYHFVMECAAGGTIRTKYWAELSSFTDWQTWSEVFRFQFIMNAGLEDSEITSIMCNFVSELWLQRFQ